MDAIGIGQPCLTFPEGDVVDFGGPPQGEPLLPTGDKWSYNRYKWPKING